MAADSEKEAQKIEREVDIPTTVEEEENLMRKKMWFFFLVLATSSSPSWRGGVSLFFFFFQTWIEQRFKEKKGQHKKMGHFIIAQNMNAVIML